MGLSHRWLSDSSLLGPAGRRNGHVGGDASAPVAPRRHMVMERTERGVSIIELRDPDQSGFGERLEWLLDNAFRAARPRIVVDASMVDAACDLTVLTDAAERAVDWAVPFAVGGLTDQHPFCSAPATRQLCHQSLEQATTAVLNEHLAGERTRLELQDDVARLTNLLASTPVLEQAIGMLMAMYGITAPVARELLHRHSSTHHRTAEDVARQLTTMPRRQLYY